ncbi:unnamed protein product [Lactuca saligna]|uniref:Uncharacterized protein n=1 Tax=Lactuca saligna TaxID=75948 RepID=A0AA36EBF7_LACSI|nr:unnamed protein product [Lactuca saligna]
MVVAPTSHHLQPQHDRPSPPFLPSIATLPSSPSPPLSYSMFVSESKNVGFLFVYFKVGMLDPPREEVREVEASIEYNCRHEGPGNYGQLPLVKPYMVAVQSNNVSAVNKEFNEVYVEEEDYDRLLNCDVMILIDAYGLLEIESWMPCLKGLSPF